MKAPAITLAATLMLAPAFAQTAAVDDLLAGYRAAGAGPFSAEAGRTMWSQSFPNAGEVRRCATCHTEDLRRTGKHAQTGKPIDPMAPSVNAKRLTDPKFV